MTDLVEETCIRCKCRFAIPRDTQAVLRQSSQTFYCTFGHGQHYPQGPTEAQQLRQERDRLKQNEAWYEGRLKDLRGERDAAERSARAYKGQATKLRQRAKAGICPCCNRHFDKLAQHMASKHPDFQPEAPEQ